MEETKYVPIEVHREFEKRIEDENHRQNTRLSALEDAVREMTRLTVSVEKIAVSLENMTAEQKRISDRLMAIEAGKLY